MLKINLAKAFGSTVLLFGGTLLLFDPAPAAAQARVQSYVYGSDMIEGSGNIVTETRAVSNFSKVRIEDATDLVVRQGNRVSLTISTDDNIIGMVHSEVEGDDLVLRSKGSYSTEYGVRAELTVPDLDMVTVQGSGDIRFVDWQDSRLSLNIHGSGDIEVSGAVERLDANVHGSGDIALRNVRVGALRANVHGSGDIAAGSPARLHANVHGSGAINYSGAPVIEHAEVYGTGEIEKL